MSPPGSRRPSRLAAFSLPLVLLAAACAAGPEVEAPAPALPSTPAAEPTGPPAEAPEERALAVFTPELRGVDLDTIEASLFDQGRMWTFEFPPLDYLAEEYGLRPDEAWFEKARLASLRLSNCSASFVSPNGLVLTNHHCARESVTAVDRDGEDLLYEGFYARSLAEEREAGDAFYADQLIALVDVTDEVESRLEGLSDQERAQRREQILDEVGEAVGRDYGGEEEDIVVEVISLWNGGYYSAYVFRRYHDIKLVMAPGLDVGFFGGDPDNFTYPRYNLDFSFFRVYGDDGEPLNSEPYFHWDDDGAAPGEPVFIVGNPGSTSRLQSVAQLEFRRDVSDRHLLAFLRERIEVLRAFADAHPAEAERLDLINTIFGLQNSEKAYEGQVGGLQDLSILARRLKLEQAFRDSIMSDPALREEYGGLYEELAELQERKREFAPAYGAFLALTAEGFSSVTLHRALLAFQVLNARQRGAPDEALTGLLEGFRGIGDQPDALDRALMAARFRDFAELYGESTGWVQGILQGRSPMAAAEAITAASSLSDSASAVAALDDGTLTMNDPALQVVAGYLQTFGGFQRALSTIDPREQEIAAALGRARLEVFGTAIPPDATFSLRIADGVVKGFEYNGTIAPTHTTFYGLYDRYYSFAHMYEDGESPWDLPPRWLTPPDSFDLSTEVNFVSTNDIIGGNSGSPVLDAELDVVGVVFDGNIESLPGDYIYLPESNRSVSVDVRGILEALDDMYDMDRLVVELTTGVLPGAGEGDGVEGQPDGPAGGGPGGRR